MIKLLIFFFSFFIPITIGFFWFMRYQANRDKEEQEPFYIKLITSLALSLILTTVLMIFIFIIFGSVSFAKSFLSFDININNLLFISTIIIIYSIFIDHIIYNVIKHIIGENSILIIIINTIRFSLFFLFGLFFSLENNTIFIISLVITLLFLLIDILNLKTNQVNN